MNKKYLLLAGSLLGLTTLATTQAPTPKQVEDAAHSIDQAKTATVSRTFTARKPAPAKPVAPVAKQRVQVAYRLISFLGTQYRFPERPVRRKVKYGKNRWVILG